jgi:adenylosuccinate lyase
VLLALVQGGLARDEAYRIVQDNATAAWREKRSFRALIDADTRVVVASELLDEAFDLQRSLRHSGAVFGAIDAIS